MGKIAYVFSGQGDQYPGMGKDIFENFEVAAKVFEMCDEIRPGTSKQCFEGAEDELKETKNTQPCLFAMELSATKVLADNGIKPDVVAGFSLGEVVAATVAGIFDEKSGFELVCRRGELMQEAAEKFETSMAAVVKLDNEIVNKLCEKYTQVYPVNFNCPGQVSVAGLTSQMTDFSADVKAAGGRAIPLKVKGAFHSPFMRDASEKFKIELERKFAGESSKSISEGFKNYKDRGVILYSDMTAKAYTEDVVSQLSQQISSPVQWEKIIRNMIADGVDTFIEVGPGKTLTNMIKKIDKSVNADNYENFI
jgi:[acyl-carrier-protein] S-malonyltransferase